ncbi:MAG TPA: acyloxyacyl hydrolase [Bacteroidales bacterium]|nr:acyloxyacyl hydrolase [Bacteroidales bacterium]HSA43919.1 acyloxyacyl hydrolase [Bacteroidales bacterium]
MTLKARIACLFYLCLGSFLPASGNEIQTITQILPPWGIETAFSSGFIIPHHLDMQVYTNRHLSIMEFSLRIPTDGSRAWHHAYHFPERGWSYLYSSLGNSEILGDVHGIQTWIRFPLVRSGNSSLHLKPGLGLGWFRKVFDPRTNYKNLAIGSHLNVNLGLSAEYRIELSEQCFAGLRAGLVHFSNGTIVTPNYGINIPTMGVTFGWQQRRVWKPARIHQDTLKNKTLICIGMAAGTKQILPAGGRSYAVASFSLCATYRFFANGALGAGIDFFLDSSDELILSRKGKETPHSLSLVKPGLKVIRSWEIGRFAFDFQLGCYLGGKDQSDGSVYDILEMRYFMFKQWYLSCFLKTHYAKADFIGWGSGWAFGK